MLEFLKMDNVNIVVYFQMLLLSIVKMFHCLRTFSFVLITGSRREK